MCTSTVAITSHLIEAGAPYECEDLLHALQQHPLYIAARKGNEEIVQVLVKSGRLDLTKRYPSTFDFKTKIWARRTIREQLEYDAASKDVGAYFKESSQRGLALLDKYCSQTS